MKTLDLPIASEVDLEPVTVLRMIDPTDRRDWLRLLPQSTPELWYWSYANNGGYYRWSMPFELAEKIWGKDCLVCQCCGEPLDSRTNDDRYLFDTRAADTEWWFEE